MQSNHWRRLNLAAAIVAVQWSVAAQAEVSDLQSWVAGQKLTPLTCKRYVQLSCRSSTFIIRTKSPLIAAFKGLCSDTLTFRRHFRSKPPKLHSTCLLTYLLTLQISSIVENMEIGIVRCRFPMKFAMIAKITNWSSKFWNANILFHWDITLNSKNVLGFCDAYDIYF